MINMKRKMHEVNIKEATNKNNGFKNFVFFETLVTSNYGFIAFKELAKDIADDLEMWNEDEEITYQQVVEETERALKEFQEELTFCIEEELKKRGANYNG